MRIMIHCSSIAATAAHRCHPLATATRTYSRRVACGAVRTAPHHTGSHVYARAAAVSTISTPNPLQPPACTLRRSAPYANLWTNLDVGIGTRVFDASGDSSWGTHT